MRILFCVLLTATALSGCASDSGEETPAPTTTPAVTDPYEAVRVLMADVPCASSVGSGTSSNLLELSHFNFTDGVGSQEIDIKGHLMLSAASGGFGLVDITDPLAPAVLSEYREAGGAYDVKFSPDNLTAIVGRGDGVALVDISDPAFPVLITNYTFGGEGSLLDQFQVSLNAHMIYTAHIAGRDWVFIAPNSSDGVWIYTLDGDAQHRTMTYAAQTMPLRGGPLGPHDMYVHVDPLTKDWYLYAADGYEGWSVYNVNNPEHPKFIGGSLRPELGYTHTIQAGLANGKRYVATIQEVGVNLLEVYDATNILAPVLLAAWTVGPTKLVEPQHNFNIVNGTLYLAHYDEGLFIFDLRTLSGLPVVDSATFAPVAHFGPSNESPVPGLFGGFWDHVVHNGILWGSSFSGPTNGITAIAYGCITPGDPAETSDG